ncbi:hypothetical protein SAMN05428985_103397 [Nocardioides sp. YR527]|uniref:hypothetical protein n=1 Tax=Nocardioides sp. YR527 TaxID=1881028 RepID=UPI00087F7264|nr:hypothetical protein [Nocardioides sp. YR527]SDK28427.1 hypothetical protein SAMN05428985_103397 [Nocardioides sp. YR527]
MGAGGAVLIIVVGAILLFFVTVALVLLVAAGVVRLSGKNPKPLAWSGVGVLAVPVLFVATLVVWSQVTRDPDTIELDLREPVRLSSLPEDNEDFPGIRDYDSDRIDLVLPDGEHFEAEVDGILVWSDDVYVTRVTFDRRAREKGETESLTRKWERELGGAGTVEVDADYSDHGRVRAAVSAEPAP